jgi:hypothetical protein
MRISAINGGVKGIIRGHFPYYLLDLVGKIREVSLYFPDFL